VIQYWVKPEKVNPGVFITVFLVVIVLINYVGVRWFGELEFWLSSIKVLVICGLIILSLVLALGGGPNHDRTGFRYYKHPGAFKEYIATGAEGRFLGFWSSMVTAVFAYLGVCESSPKRSTRLLTRLILDRAGWSYSRRGTKSS
jgi:amino acid transporter